jgi:hypothetical protein
MVWDLIAEIKITRNTDLQWMLGAPPMMMGTLRNGSKNGDMVVPGICRAVIIRHLLGSPEDSPLPGEQSPKLLFERINTFMTMSRAEFAVLLGRSGISGHRWLSESPRDDVGASLDVERLVLVINLALDRAGRRKQDLLRVVEHFRALMLREAQGRGYDLDRLVSDATWVKRDEIHHAANDARARDGDADTDAAA